MRISLATTAQGDRYVAEQDDGYRLVGCPETSYLDLVTSESLSLGPVVEVSDIRSPLRPGKIVAIGLNYLDHIREVGAEAPTHPLVFAKFPSTIISNGDHIVINTSLAERVDWEVELAVVIGQRAKNVEESNALRHVFGYSVANDVSARDVQFRDGQWIRGKNFDTFCPLGPVVTADEIHDPQTLGLGTRVNGVLKQESNTSLMLFSVADIIAFCSSAFALEPGDVILSGTPWGCGEFMNPRESLRDGDLVEVWVDRIGSIFNRVVAV